MAMNARVLLPAPSREPLPFGVLSVVDVVDDAEPRWVTGGAQAEIDTCLVDLGVASDACVVRQREDIDINAVVAGTGVTLGATGTLVGEVVPDKDVTTPYGLIEGDAYTLYLVDGCQTLNRIGDADSRAREAFAVGEPAGMEVLFLGTVLEDAAAIPGAAAGCVAEAIGRIESWAAVTWASRPTLYIPRTLAPFAFRDNVLLRVGDHLETQGGSKVGLVAGDADDSIYVSGSVALHRSPLATYGPVFNQVDNTYILLAERSYLPLVSCGVAKIAVTDGCGGGA